MKERRLRFASEGAFFMNCLWFKLVGYSVFESPKREDTKSVLLRLGRLLDKVNDIKQQSDD